MIVLLQLASLMILKLFSCTEMKSPEGHLPLSDIHPRAASVISSYLDNPGSVDGHFSELYRADLASKRIFIDIPELIADDIDKMKGNSSLLFWISQVYCKSGLLISCIEERILHGNKFDAVLPNLMRYFDRYQPVRCKTDEIKVLIRNNKFDYIFHDAPDTLKTLTMVLHQDNNLISLCKSSLSPILHTLNVLVKCFRQAGHNIFGEMDQHCVGFKYANDNFLK